MEKEMKISEAFSVSGLQSVGQGKSSTRQDKVKDDGKQDRQDEDKTRQDEFRASKHKTR